MLQFCQILTAMMQLQYIPWIVSYQSNFAHFWIMIRVKSNCHLPYHVPSRGFDNQKAVLLRFQIIGIKKNPYRSSKLSKLFQTAFYSWRYLSAKRMWKIQKENSLCWSFNRAMSIPVAFTFFLRESLVTISRAVISIEAIVCYFATDFMQPAFAMETAGGHESEERKQPLLVKKAPDWSPGRDREALQPPYSQTGKAMWPSRLQDLGRRHHSGGVWLFWRGNCASDSGEPISSVFLRVSWLWWWKAALLTRLWWCISASAWRRKCWWDQWDDCAGRKGSVRSNRKPNQRMTMMILTASREPAETAVANSAPVCWWPAGSKDKWEHR